MSLQSVGSLTRTSDIPRFVEAEQDREINNLLFSNLRLQMDENVETGDSVATDSVPAITPNEASQTVAFLDDDSGNELLVPTSDASVANVDGTLDLQLGEFLSRPTLINTTSWSTSDLVGVKTTILPWHLFLNNVVIKKKLDNFAFLRGVLHVKYLLNGTPFQFGLIRTAYSPLLGLVSDKVRTNPTSALPLLIPYSQQPGVWLHPQDNAGGEMSLPFFYHKNWLDITSAVDVQNMGTINEVVYAPLAVAVSGGSTIVTVQTYAWMTDVQLMASTSKLALQADEYVEGAISGPATAIARVAGSLGKVPVIGKFARATQIGANAIGGIARLFGYTNPPVIAEVHGFHPMNAPMLASAHISVPAQKLTLDPKQELSIDPKIHGLSNSDELALDYLCSRESYLSATSWSTSDSIDTQLFNMRVNPALFGQIELDNTVPAAVANRVYHTPLSYTANMFRHWRGSIIVHVKVVCTKFHKGRLKISYDPLNDISTTSPGENTVYTQILDIGEQDDLEIEIPYHQATSWLNVDTTIQNNFSPGNTLAPRIGTDNGLLTFRVLTNLTAPASGFVYLLFSVKGGTDFEFANPREAIGSTLPMSFLNVQGNETVDQTPSRWVIGTPSSPTPGTFGMNFGERVGSLRNILHRSSVRDTVWLPTLTASAISAVYKTFRIMPNQPGYSTNAPYAAHKILVASGNANYSFVPMHPMCYISGMFLGYRGGTTITVTPSTEVAGFVEDLRVVRLTSDPGDNSQSSYVSVPSYYLSSYTAGQKAFFPFSTADKNSGNSGLAITATNTNGSIQFDLPDFKKYNFSLVDPAVSIVGNSADGTNDQVAQLRMLLKAGASTDTTVSTIQTEACAGPDFTCLFFLCCPTIDVTVGLPTPV